MTATKLAALRKYAAARPKAPMIAPAMAGPTMRVPWNVDELRATTWPIFSGGTSSGRKAW